MKREFFVLRVVLVFLMLSLMACAAGTRDLEFPTTVVGSSYRLFVSYRADHFPQENYPAFTFWGSPNTDLFLENGVLRVVDRTYDQTGRGFFHRGDPIKSTDHAVMEFRARVSAAPSSLSVAAGFWDDEKAIRVGITRDSVGFVFYDLYDKSGKQWVAKVLLDGTAFHTYRLVKNGREPVVLFVDGNQVLTVEYNEFAPNRSSVPDIGFGAGLARYLLESDSEWEYVWYQIESEPSVSTPVTTTRYLGPVPSPTPGGVGRLFSRVETLDNGLTVIAKCSAAGVDIPHCFLILPSGKSVSDEINAWSFDKHFAVACMGGTHDSNPNWCSVQDMFVGDPVHIGFPWDQYQYEWSPNENTLAYSRPTGQSPTSQAYLLVLANAETGVQKYALQCPDWLTIKWNDICSKIQIPPAPRLRSATPNPCP